MLFNGLARSIFSKAEFDKNVFVVMCMAHRVRYIIWFLFVVLSAAILLISRGFGDYLRCYQNVVGIFVRRGGM